MADSYDLFVAGQLLQNHKELSEILERLFQLQKAKLGTDEASFSGIIQKVLEMDSLTESADTHWTYLYYTGYLMAIPHKGQDWDRFRSKSPNIAVDFFIPNEEILEAWKTFFDEAMFGKEKGPSIRQGFLSLMERWRGWRRRPVDLFRFVTNLDLRSWERKIFAVP